VATRQNSTCVGELSILTRDAIEPVVCALCPSDLFSSEFHQMTIDTARTGMNGPGASSST
jgi:hypothetical protein